MQSVILPCKCLLLVVVMSWTARAQHDGSRSVCRRRSIEEDRSTDTRFEITCGMVEIYNEVVHDLLSTDVKRQVELQKTATGFDIPSITTVGARSGLDPA